MDDWHDAYYNVILGFPNLFEKHPEVEKWILDDIEAFKKIAEEYRDEIERGISGLYYLERELKKRWESIDKK